MTWGTLVVRLKIDPIDDEEYRQTRCAKDTTTFEIYAVFAVKFWFARIRIPSQHVVYPSSHPPVCPPRLRPPIA